MRHIGAEIIGLVVTSASTVPRIKTRVDSANSSVVRGNHLNFFDR
jgi:hypothetical protein